MKLDIKKTNQIPQWNAIELMIKTQGNVVGALYITCNAVKHNTNEFKEIMEYIGKFIKKTK